MQVARPSMDLKSYVVDSSDGAYSRRVWFLPEPSLERRRLCVFLDGEHYLGRIQAAETLTALRAGRLLPPFSSVFVSNGDTEARHRDLTCNASFARYVAEDVVPWVRARDPLLKPGGAVICGSSLSGLAAAHLGVLYPDVFSQIICQSGSFWWNEEWFTRTVDSHAPLSGWFWLSAGDKETACPLEHAPTGLRQEVSQISAVVRAAEALRRAGANVEYREFHGAHDQLRWKEEMQSALPWIGRSARAAASAGTTSG